MTAFFEKFPLEKKLYLQDSKNKVKPEKIVAITTKSKLAFKSIFIYPSVYRVNCDFLSDLEEYYQLLLSGLTNDEEKSRNARIEHYHFKVKEMILNSQHHLAEAILHLLGLVSLLKESLTSTSKSYIRWYQSESEAETQELITLLSHVQDILLISYGMAGLQADMHHTAEGWGVFASVIPPALGMGVLITLQIVAPFLLAAPIAGIIGVAAFFGILVLSLLAYSIVSNRVFNSLNEKNDLTNYKVTALDRLKDMGVAENNDNNQLETIFNWPAKENVNRNIIECLKELVENVVRRTYCNESAVPKCKMN